MVNYDIVSPQYRPKMLNLTALGTTGIQEVTQIVCVADIAGSLNSKYFLYNTPSVNYYVWIDVASAGVDPAIAGRTGIQVAIASGATNTAVATAVTAAMDALSTIAATRVSATVTATNAADGAVTNAVDGTAATGFTITTPTQGVTSLVALSMGKFNATIAESGAGPGDYTITFNDKFVQVPQVVVLGTSTVAPRLVSVTTSAVQVEMNDLSGNPVDADFHMLVIGSQATDLIL